VLTHGSLFAGIGGFDLGFERAGIKTVWQVEIDPFCRKVLEKNFPHAERFDDIRGCGRHNLTGVDVIAGGFPCQDVSNAGKRAGIDGTRSGLWSQMRRVICELRPRIVVVENVAALLGRGLERVLGDLAESGFDAEWDCIPAFAVGAPHRRDRVFIVAYPKQQRQQASRQERN
jgi:DNA (cytosine-5)-methyltransferase 1